ncbi:hypothetical protein CBR_g40785 [Chara braunii]|uniref:Uncharacterized protein n=1 Tax=Chara braunii TaxID=69332 RepID=A0A388LUT1_CHABU|nr:hypothetical protein CBR_g40785 [Chara braunii]|eukprot:GBG85972.1 hypothetical protein CBR_g40785 [Chara braunii]
MTKSKGSGSAEVVRLKAHIDVLRRGKNGASTSALVVKPTPKDEVARVRREQAEAKAAMEKRFASMEKVIFALQKQCEIVEANEEAWKLKALRPGNNWGCVAIDQTPYTEVKVTPRVTLGASPDAVGRVNLQLKGMVEQYQREVDLLKEMRIREVNERKESEEEVERLKEAVVRLQTSKKTRGTNLKTKLDDAA